MSEISKMIGASSLPEFDDFDDGKVYERCHKAAARGDTRNFVIEFDSTKAYAAHNLNDASVKQLLQLEVIDFAYNIPAIEGDAGYIQFCSNFEG